MTIKVNAAEFTVEFQKIISIAPKNPIIPILECVKVERFNDSQITLTTSNLKATATVTIDCTSVTEGDAFCVDAGLLGRTIAQLGGADVELQVVDGKLIITCGLDKYQMPAESAGDYPVAPDVTTNQTVTIDPDLIEYMKSLSPFCSKDEMKAALNGVHVKSDGEISIIEATNAHVVGRYKMQMESDPFELLIKPADISHIATLFGDSGATVKISENNIVLEDGQTSLSIRLIDECYPDVDNIIPKDNQEKIRIQRSDLIDAIKKTSSYSSKSSNAIRVLIGKDGTVVTAEDIDFERLAQTKIDLAHDKDLPEFAVNKDYLSLILDRCSDKTQLEFESPDRGILLKSGGFLGLVMPIVIG